mgnify:CR=1 FL=1
MKVEFGAMEEPPSSGSRRRGSDPRQDVCGRAQPHHAGAAGAGVLHRPAHPRGSSEIVYVLSGTGKALYGGGEERLTPGDCHYCPEGHAHSLINDGTQTLEFFAVVPQHG